MTTLVREKINESLELLAQDLDISPSKYKQAVERYQTVAKYLEEGTGYPGAPGEISFYCQGSFRLGTVVRPFRDGKNADYDIDLVCQYPAVKSTSNRSNVKNWVGNRLKEDGTYRKMLQPEGKRCWTLDYAETDGVGFHLDVLPSVEEDAAYKQALVQTGIHPGVSVKAIAITDKSKDTGNYSWSSSNPNGYAEWFEEANQAAFQSMKETQKSLLFESNREIYESIEDVPDLLVRTPLQRVIQIFKRHRDYRFAGKVNEKYKPISIIITTLAAKAYQNETNVVGALEGILSRLAAFESLLEDRSPSIAAGPLANLITRDNAGHWYITNPVNRGENFADRWHEDGNARARAFFQWIGWLRHDILNALQMQNINEAQTRLAEGFGTDRIKNVMTRVQKNSSNSTKRAYAIPHVVINNPEKPWANE